jgi:hypothetical protein
MVRDYIIENACASLVRKAEAMFSQPNENAAQFHHKVRDGDSWIITAIRLPDQEKQVA